MRVFYYLRSKPRGRHLDTVKYVPKGITPIYPKFDYVEGKTNVKRGNLLTDLITYFPFSINIKSLPKGIHADMAYTFGALLNDKIPYVVEIDNPSCLTYYSPISLKNPLIKHVIRSFVFKENFVSFLPISKAAMKGLINVFGEDISDKVNVVYPVFPYNVDVEPNDDPTFLFISYHFWIKGGRELVKAAKRLKGDFKLTMITRLPENIKVPKNVRVINKMPRDELITKVVPNHNVIVHPTYMDSFGMAVYEAVNVGLAGIVSDVYALPEFVDDGKNGFIIKSPIRIFDERYVPSIMLWRYKDVERYVLSHQFPRVVDALVENMQYYIDNPKEIKRHKRHSKAKRKEFSLDKRNKVLSKIFGL